MIDAKNLCQKRDCPHAATHAVKICVPVLDANRDPSSAAKVLMGVVLCEDHLDEADPQAFLESAGATLKPIITMGNPGRDLDYPRAYIEGVPLTSPEYQALAAAPRPN